MMPEKCKIVYLDQKCWINLAKLYYTDKSKKESHLLKKILDASEKNKIIFPLSLSHVNETNRISSDKRRNQLAFLMSKISKAYTIQPYVDKVIRAEIRNIVLQKHGLEPKNIRESILKKGISNLLGAKATLVPRKDKKNSMLSEGVKKGLLDLLETPEAIELALNQRPPTSLEHERKALVTKLETIRSDLSTIKDNNLRQRVFFAQNITAIVAPELAKASIQFNLPKDFFLKMKPTRKDIEDLLDAIPTARCFLTLIYHRDSQLQRPIQTNDFNDIWFLTLAIPYSDIVVTERMWTSIATRAKLNKKYDTEILSSIQQLEQYL